MIQADAMLLQALGASNGNGLCSAGNNPYLEHSISIADETTAIGVADLKGRSGHGWRWAVEGLPSDFLMVARSVTAGKGQA